MIKIGDKVLLTQTGTIALVDSITDHQNKAYPFISHGETIRLGLTSDFGPAKVSLHDRNKTWFLYSELN